MTSSIRSPAPPARPKKPPPSTFGIGVALGIVGMTVVTAAGWRFGTGFWRMLWPISDGRLAWPGLIDAVTDATGRANPVIRAIPNAQLGQMFSSRDRNAFLETLGIAVISTTAGTIVAMPLALWSTRFGAPTRSVQVVVRSVSNVIRSFPDVLWALLMVAAVGVGALPGILALFFFSIAVITKLTADTLDGIDMGPLEAANASGAGHSQMLRTSVVPQILPNYASYSLYAFELNLRAAVVVGLVGGGGIGARVEFFRNNYPGADRWEKIWGLVFMFLIVVFVVDRISIMLRRRLV